MRATVLHWFRSRQRALGRVVLAAFCLTWLQLAALPCVMAVGAQPAAAGSPAAPAAMAMPAGMQMAPGEHCPYCPPEQPAPGPAAGDVAHCLYPHDPQVDTRAAFAAVLLAPPPPAPIVLAADALPLTTAAFDAATSDPSSGTPLAISYCRYLK